MANASYAARQPPAVEGEKPVHVLVTGFGVSSTLLSNGAEVWLQHAVLVVSFHVLTLPFLLVPGLFPR
jgi:hypothetical protein